MKMNTKLKGRALLLIGGILVLLGVMIWGIFGTIENTVPACIVSDEAAAVCYVSARDADRIAENMIVRAGDAEGVLSGEILQAEALPTDAQAVLGDADAYMAQVHFESLPRGAHEAEVIVERITPISFVLQ